MKHFFGTSFIEKRGMPRRFRLGRLRKNGFKKRSTLVVEHAPIALASVAVSAVPENGREALAQESDILQGPSLEPLVVSVPLEVLLNAAAPSLDVMRSTILTLSVLPPGTVLIQYIFFCFYSHFLL